MITLETDWKMYSRGVFYGNIAGLGLLDCTEIEVLGSIRALLSHYTVN